MSAGLRFGVALAFATCWATFSIWVSQPWLADLGELTHPDLALVVLTFVAYVPGFMNAFLLLSLVQQPENERQPLATYPPLTLLVAAYQEEESIGRTLRDLLAVDYPGTLETLVIDDGSRDRTVAEAEAWLHAFDEAEGHSLRLLRQPHNQGKARALNRGLREARHHLIVTIDADTCLDPGSLTALVERFAIAPEGTAATAGTVLVANHDESWICGAQQWDYFHGIAAVKRMQGMYHGTLVAQGAFSLYRKDALLAIGGWPDTVGEDIVLTWAMLDQGHLVSHAQDAIAWTQAPATVKALIHQRKRWARGMIEALAEHDALLLRPRLHTMFIWWNLLFITLDATFTLVFLPGVILALCGVYWLAGPITLLVLPLAALWNLVIYRIQSRMLARQGVHMKRNWLGFASFTVIYPLLMQPVSLWGYMAEFAGRRKEWGTA
jgi:biofilm PGA synthesis N-glycosyltransferase PgaC